MKKAILVVPMFSMKRERIFVRRAPVLGWWGRRLRKDLDESEANREAVASTEEFFLSLYDDRAGDIEESAVLKYLFAIMLERKRILKPVGRAMPGEPQTYLMRKSGRKFDVPIVDVTAQSVNAYRGAAKGVP